MPDTCAHLGAIDTTDATANGCVECLAAGGRWVHLRRCASCGHVGCCDSSPGRHATAHFSTSGHPLIQSFEPAEDWFWCYVDEVAFERPEDGPSPSHP
ncbi:MAG: UBP-type zinc finger domain-containing protein [Acidimicrobiales bacterium]